MSKFSLVVTAYDNAAYLPGCLDSIARQKGCDWECIVINDASPDETGRVAAGYAARDSRFRLVTLPKNVGLHLARKAGVRECTGDFVIFIDADDELAEGALGELADVVAHSDADMVHFGIEVIPSGVGQAECDAFGDYVNAAVEELEGHEICEKVFVDYAQDWRVTQRAYGIDLAREAFGAMCDTRLERAEDCYEFFVLADCARKQLTANDCVVLRYCYGRGVTGTSKIGLERFESFSAQFGACLDAVLSYASSHPECHLDGCAKGAKGKLLDLLMNDWLNRVGAADREAAARDAARVLGGTEIAAQLARLSRDAAYADLVAKVPYSADAEYVSWFRLADDMVEDVTDEAFSSFRTAAVSHISDLEASAFPREVSADDVRPIRLRDYERQSVRIFVTTHKNVDLFHGSVLQPVQVGPLSGRKRFCWALQDDSGDNIAEKNPMYCELTTQYWAWKNADADYYGFCHYRRYFDFSSVEHPENAYGEVMDSFIDWGAQGRYGLDDESIRAAVEGYDVVTTQFKDLRKFPERFATPLDHYAAAPYLSVDDLRRCMDILTEMHPDYDEDAYAFLSGHTSCFCNMFIMRKDLFFRYCEWLFPILERFCEQWDRSKASHERLRTPGHLSERLLNIFLIHERRTNPDLKAKQLQCVHFEHPERAAEPVLEPCDSRGLPVVPMVFAADNNYVPMLTTTLYSVLKNASVSSFYDVVVLEKDISEKNKGLMRSFFSRFGNASLRFLDVSALMRAYNLQTSNEHISVETYYRFLIQQVLPGYDKVLYLDADLIVTGDVAELFATELGDNLVAAAPDIDYLANLNLNDGERMAYTREVLGLKDPYGYFQAGVLVLNTREMRALHPFERWLEIASEPKYIYDDQDILNAHCQGRVVYLDNSWNVMNDCGGRIKKLFTFAPAEVYDRFCAAYDAPRVVHYAGFEKPWKPGPCDRRELYWSYARETPFYEALLGMAVEPRQVSGRALLASKTDPSAHERVFSETAGLRKVLDPVFPLGSRRREALKSVGRILRGRK